MPRADAGYIESMTAPDPDPDPVVDRTTGQLPHLSLGPHDRPRQSLPVRIVKRVVKTVIDILSLP